VAPTEADDAREILRREVGVMEQLSWDELDGYEDRTTEISSDSGRTFRVRTMTYCDMDPWQSDRWMVAEAHSLGRRTHRKWSYREDTIRGGEELPE
jgi:hypothetical protein